ncbi:hypothetical protein D3C72_2079000 [compost metagenome]
MHPTFVARLQGGRHQCVFVRIVLVQAFARHARGLHNQVHAGGMDAALIDQVFGGPKQAFLRGGQGIWRCSVHSGRTIVLHEMAE